MKKSPLAVAAIVLVFLIPHLAFAATMGVLPSTQSVSVGDLITTRISIDTQGRSINQGEADIGYPSNLLSVVSINKSASVFSFWVTDPASSAGVGTISFNGGLPTPGYSGADGTIVTITFRAKAAGTATVSLSNSALRANDGLGTDILQGVSPAVFVISPATTSVAPPVSTPAPTPAATPKPDTQPVAGTVTLSSPTNPDQHAWYANANPTISWQVPSAATAVEVVASQDKNAVPSVAYTDTTHKESLTDLADGTWYFNLRYKLAGTWSSVSTYTFNVDTSPPVIDSHLETYDASQHALVLAVTAHDAGSGIAGYELAIDGGPAKELPSDAFAQGTYAYPISTRGPHTFVLRTKDQAGNYADTPGTFTVPVPLLETPVFMIGSVAVPLLALLIGLALISVLSLVAAITAWVWLLVHAGPETTRRRADRQKVHKAFALLRDDLDKNLRVLKKARTGKDLSVAESSLGHEMHQDINDFERYLHEETDLLA